MNSQEFNQVLEAKKRGWTFTHLSGLKMSASNKVDRFIVNCKTSTIGYKMLLKKINEYESLK